MLVTESKLYRGFLLSETNPYAHKEQIVFQERNKKGISFSSIG
jgi:hypothetical protein